MVQLHLSTRIERMVRFGLILILSIVSVKCNSCYSEYFVLLKSRLCGRDAWEASYRRALNRVMPVTVTCSNCFCRYSAWKDDHFL